MTRQGDLERAPGRAMLAQARRRPDPGRWDEDTRASSADGSAPARSPRSVPRTVLLGSVLLVAALAHGLNLLGFPYYENDEGVYAGQAWAVLRLGQLAPYAYTYDHPPLGWLLLAAWAGLTAGLHTFGTAIDSGRVLMLVLQLGSTALVYGIGRRLSGRRAIGAVAGLLFALSAVGIYYHRRVLLDNVATFWLVLAISLLVGQDARARPSRAGLVGSALAFGAAILTKEVTAAFLPALLAFAAWRADGWRWRPAVGWLALALAVAALYPLHAYRQGELAPAWMPTLGTHSGISLLGTLAEQMGRGRDGGLLQPGSQFWSMGGRWVREEPLLVAGGTLAAMALVCSIRRRPAEGAIGLAVLLFWLFLGRGGQTLPFYILPILPLLALSVALVAGALAERVGGARRGVGPERPGLPAGLALLAVPLLLLLPGYTAPTLGLGDDPLALWRNHQADAQRQAMAWFRDNAEPTSRIVVDDALWPDLRDGPRGGPDFPNAHPYWKLERDPAVRDAAFAADWRRIDYVGVSPQMRADVASANLTLLSAALENSRPVASFDAGGWPLEIRRVGGR